MNVIDKVVIKNGVDADTVKTINLNTGQVDEINAILATISNTRGVAAYSVATGKAQFSWEAVGENEMWVYLDGVGIKIGGVATITPSDFYEGIVSTTSLGADYNQVKSLVVNRLGNYKVGNVVKLHAKHTGFMGSIYYLDYYGEITAINEGTKTISVTLINSLTGYTAPSAEWTFNLVATDYDGLEYLLLPYKQKKETPPFIWSPTVTETKNLESDSGATGTARQIIVIGLNASSAYTIDIKVTSISEYEIYTIVQSSPYNYNPLSIITSGGTFWDTTTTKSLHPNKGADIANGEFKLSIRIMRVGTLIYIL